VQAHEFTGGLWAVGMRLAGSAASEAGVETAVAAREIVRSWPMRGTLHFVPAEDLRWMLRLLTPRIAAGLGWRDRQLGLDEVEFTKAAKILTRALEGGGSLSRPAAYGELERGGVSPGGQRGIHILGALALNGLLCFGAREGNQPTFVLLDEWIPAAGSAAIGDDEALARLAERYFRGHGPATLADFVWWSGLRVGEARRAIEIAGDALESATHDGTTRYSVGAAVARKRRAPSAELLPPWDEFLVGYRDRTAALGHIADHDERKLELLGRPIVLVDGRARGAWRRELKPGAVRVSVELWEALNAEEIGAIESTAARYAGFLRRELQLSLAKSRRRRR
jgi:hypothetical protein